MFSLGASEGFGVGAAAATQLFARLQQLHLALAAAAATAVVREIKRRKKLSHLAAPPGAVAPAPLAAASPVLGGVQTLPGGHCYDELDVNDYPGEARYRATHRDNILRVQEETGCAIIARGQYIAPGKTPEPGQKRLYLALEAKDELSIKHAKAELKRLLDEETRELATSGGKRGRDAMANYGKYSLI